MADVTANLTETYPSRRAIPETPNEATLRALYPHPPGMIRLGMISGARGEAAGTDGSSRSLQGPGDLRVFRVLRAAADVILVGGATARSERYGAIHVRDALAASRSPNQAPTPIVAVLTLTGSMPGRLGPHNALLVTTRRAPAAALAAEWGDSLVLAGDLEPSPSAMIAAFADRGLTRVLCEGGPTLARLFLDASAVTDYCLTTSPLPGDEGGPHVPSVPGAMRLIHTLESEGFVMRRWSHNPVDVTLG